MSLTLLDEVNIWMEHELANPNQLMENDPLLLELVSLRLYELRLRLIEDETPELREEYNQLYTSLVNLLTYRINKEIK
jgi:hypothetical protein